jgi:hypothetical protein
VLAVRGVRGVLALLGVLAVLAVLEVRGAASASAAKPLRRDLAGARAASDAGEGGQPSSLRPFGTLQEQAELQQAWLKKRLDTFLPALMRKHGIDMWIVPMREYNEDPIFAAVTAPETFAARRRTIYVFFDSCAAANAPAGTSSASRSAARRRAASSRRAAPRRPPPRTWAAGSRPNCGATSSGRP